MNLLGSVPANAISSMHLFFVYSIVYIVSICAESLFSFSVVAFLYQKFVNEIGNIAEFFFISILAVADLVKIFFIFKKSEQRKRKKEICCFFCAGLSSFTMVAFLYLKFVNKIWQHNRILEGKKRLLAIVNLAKCF